MAALLGTWRESLRPAFWFIAAGFLLFAALAADPAPSAPEGAAAPELLDSRQLAGRIDAYFTAYWQQHGVVPTATADDAEFLRRAYLDLVGKIPTAAEARAFLEQPNDNKRNELVEKLLQQGAFATHFANTWRTILLAGAADNDQARALAPRLETWLKLRFAANASYDEIVRELLTARVNDNVQRAAALATDNGPDPLAFYAVSELKPELLAASTSRVFLGVQVQCAQCHDHPRAHWTRQEFWSYAAFFGELGQQGSDKPAAIKIPDTDKLVPAAYLDGAKPDFQPLESRRAALVRWITADNNRWFAAAAVNRVWDHLLGRGLIDPVDDLEAASAADHPELMTLLVQQFRLHRYDLQYLLRAVTASQVYQLSSHNPSDKAPERRHFARMPLRRMTGEQLFDSLLQATGAREARTPRNRINVLSDVESLRGAFQQKFSESNVPRTEAETSILQALSLMNGKLTADATDLKKSETLAAVADAPFLNTAAKVEALYLSTLTRRPAPEESQQLVAYVDGGGPSHDPAAALGDVFWALLNSAEFVLAH